MVWRLQLLIEIWYTEKWYFIHYCLQTAVVFLPTDRIRALRERTFIQQRKHEKGEIKT